jgi:hypothetical protein
MDGTHRYLLDIYVQRDREHDPSIHIHPLQLGIKGRIGI